MEDDSYTEVTNESWFSRIKNAIIGIFIGLIMIAGSVWLLFWNEGRTVQTYKSLKEGAGAVVSVVNDAVDRSNEGKLVHISGLATTDEVLQDSQFPVSANALMLKRTVKMYQWQESKDSKKRKKLGGGEETITTYSYSKSWSSSVVDSSRFKKSGSHKNPGRMMFGSTTASARNVMLGAFNLSAGQVSNINAFKSLPVGNLSEMPNIGRQISNSEGGLYIGNNESSPEIGDLMITFAHVPPTDVTVVAKQSGNAFTFYMTSVGKNVDLLEVGVHTAEVMFDKAQSSNTLTAWLIRLGGFVLMIIGFALLFNPLSVIADVVPFIGNIVEFGTGIIAFLLALMLSVTTIAIAWIFYRPVLAIALLIGMGVIVFLVIKAKKGKAVSAPAVKRPPIQERKVPVESSEDAFDFENDVASSSKKQSMEDPFLTDDDK